MQYRCFVLYICYNQSFMWVLRQHKQIFLFLLGQIWMCLFSLSMTLFLKYSVCPHIMSSTWHATMPIRHYHLASKISQDLFYLVLLQVLLVLLWHEGTSICWHQLSCRHIFAISKCLMCLLPLGDISRLFFRTVYLVKRLSWCWLILFPTDLKQLE